MKQLSFPSSIIISLFIIVLLSCGKDDDTVQVCCSTETATTADFQFLGRESQEQTQFTG